MKDFEMEQISDPQIKNIVESLHAIPERELPEGFDAKLRDALLKEKELMSAVPIFAYDLKAKQRIRRLRIGMSVAACFLVGILSITMYNDGIWSLPFQNSQEAQDSYYQEDVNTTEEASSSPELSGGMPAERNASAETDMESEKTAPSTESGSGDTGSGETPGPSMLAIPDGQVGTLDVLVRGTGQLSELPKELDFYAGLAEEYLAGQAYRLVSYVWDSETGEHRFNIQILEETQTDGAGKYIVLIGAEGAINEEQQPVEPIRGD